MNMLIEWGMELRGYPHRCERWRAGIRRSVPGAYVPGSPI